MNNIEIHNGDAFELIKTLPDNSVDLVITSPPYSDIVSYGKEVSVKKPTEYVDWILPLFDEIYRVLKPTGSFILNINDNCKNGVRNHYIYELVYKSQKDTKLKLYDTYIWHKMNGIPNGGKKRLRNTTEFIFHFVKKPKEIKFYMDRILRQPAESNIQRRKYNWTITTHGEIVDGERTNKKTIKYLTGSTNKTKDGYELPQTIRTLPELVRPDNVFRFPTAGLARDNHIKHPAPYHKKLPEYFINLLTDEGDVVLDPFSGIGTTGIPCKETNRKYIGYELNEKYYNFSIERLNGE